MRRLLVFVCASFVIGAFACGSTRPPVAELTTADAGERGDGTGGVGDGSSDGSNTGAGRDCYDETQARPSEDCHCTIPFVVGLSLVLPCGYGVCSSATGEEAICTNIGTVVHVPGCPALDLDASADAGGGYRLPPCDAGASADGTADAGTDADADAF